MYPNLYYVFEDLFGVRVGALRFINSFGFFVAIAFLVAASLLSVELKRKSKEGLMQPLESRITVGKPPSMIDILLNSLVGFLLGYKILALFFLDDSETLDTQAYLFSGRGNLFLGLAGAALFGWMKWREGKKAGVNKAENRVVRIWPHDRVGELTMIALVVGLVGAKLFDIFENWSDFLRTPSEYIFSGGGLTFYGGLICATIAICIYGRKNKIPLRHLADAIAPALMIAYAIGRIGCQVAGDGDWGIYNSAYKLDPVNGIAPAQPQDFKDSLSAHTGYFLERRQNPDSIQHLYAPAPGALSFLPDWFFAYNYPRNVNEVGIPISGCQDRYCKQLPMPVFPTPLYEVVMGTALFFLLWGLRKRLKVAGTLFAIYLFVNGLERFLIEKIRVNVKMKPIAGWEPTQAELIALGLMVAGILLFILLVTKYRTRANPV